MSGSMFIVERRHKGRTLGSLVREHLCLTWSQVRTLLGRGRVRVGGRVNTEEAFRPPVGARIEIIAVERGPKKAEPPKKAAPPLPPWPTTLPKPKLHYVDDAVVVVEKPAGITTMRHAQEAAEFGVRGRHYLPPTLADYLPGLIGLPERSRGVIAVHRLDRDTSGLLVFARTSATARHLEKQFRAHRIERRYLAIVRGRAKPGTIESFLVADRGDGRRGSGTTEGGQRAITQVTIREELGEFTLVECRLETGRTHQVRIHLGEQGTPLCGETIYDRPLHGRPLPDASGSPRLSLHAYRLAFTHPTTDERMEFTSPLPADLLEVVTRLRADKGGKLG